MSGDIEKEPVRDHGSTGVGAKSTSRGNCIVLKVTVSRPTGPVAVEARAYRLTVTEAEHAASQLAAALHAAAEHREQNKEVQQ
jgi:hypothetical protein